MASQLVKRVHVAAFGISLLAVLAGCANIGKEEPAERTFALQVDPLEQAAVKADIGLALSGGGIRSALFNLGLLKWLYDEQVLDRVDIISSVSGGSYAAYWLYVGHHRNPEVPRFGFNSLEQPQFGRSVCDILITSNFVPYTHMLGAAVSPRQTLPGLYEGQLKRTFGQSDDAATWNVKDFAPDMTKGAGAPYWVINSTFVDPDTDKGWAEGLMEFTPLQKGNAAYGYSGWTADQQLPAVKAVAISGAAVRAFLSQRIPNLIEGLPQETIKLSDGGHSENLGAVALIRRGVKTVIIGDAEHDPGYKFGAYKKLQTRLRAWKLDLEIREVEEYLTSRRRGGSARHGVYRGVVVDQATKKETTILYVKMGRPGVVENIIGQEPKSMPGAGVNSAYFDHLVKTAGPATAANPEGTWECNQALPVTQQQMTDWFKYAMASQYQSEQRSWRLRLTRALNIFGIYSDFPMHSTGDQSYYLRQSMAYVGLGYTEAELLRPHIGGLRSQPNQ